MLTELQKAKIINQYLEHPRVTLTVEEAQAVLDRRNRWCQLALAMSWRVRLTNWIAKLPVVWRFGKGVGQRYRERFPSEPLDMATGVLLCVPIRQRIDYSGIARKLFTVEPLPEGAPMYDPEPYVPAEFYPKKSKI